MWRRNARTDEQVASLILRKGAKPPSEAPQGTRLSREPLLSSGQGFPQRVTSARMQFEIADRECSVVKRERDRRSAEMLEHLSDWCSLRLSDLRQRRAKRSRECAEI